MNSEKGYKDDDYRLRVGGSVKNSRFDTSSDHDVEVKGDILNSNVHNYAGELSICFIMFLFVIVSTEMIA